MADTYPRAPRTTPTRHPERVSYDRAAAHAVLDEAVVCHVAFVAGGSPVVLPQVHARIGDNLYLHGSAGSGLALAARESGLAVCVAVTLLDGLVLARSAFRHSVNYRSVVVHGTAVTVRAGREKSAALLALVEAAAPGRSGQVRPPSAKELAATTVLRLPLEQVSVKARSGPPNDLPEDLPLPQWAGVLPLHQSAGAPVPADPAAAGRPVPRHVATWSR